jgi:UDP-N-acetylmuramyl tripeptide synthase
MAYGLAFKLALARAVGTLSRLRGGGATSVPGKVLMRLQPDAIGTLGARLERGSVIVSATNGKTTTASMAAGILELAGVSLVHNQAGANMAGGIATTLLEAARPQGGIAGELGLFEVDEMWLAPVAAELHPRAVLLGNLFRDQLDRYGELETIAERWAQAIERGWSADGQAVKGQATTVEGQAAIGHAGAGERTRGDRSRLILNADDPTIADLGRGRPEVLYFGVEDPSLALAGMGHASDAKHCRRCGAPYVFEVVYMGHLGHYRCPKCGQTRPAPTVTASKVRLEGVRAASFTLRTPAGETDVSLSLPGLYNVYNALAAAALATALGVGLEQIVAGLEGTKAVFGRGETVTVEVRSAARDDEHGRKAAPQRRELRILLVKNPAGANEVLRTLALEPGEHDLLGVLNDRIADGRDVSWIWDADFELLAGRVRRITCSGTRAPELALRLKYAGVDPARIRVREELELALDEAAGDGPSQTPLYALPTYTAMLALRELLVERGEASGAWS